MFDIGFSELVLIFIVGLLVLGPERLPGVIKTGSLWLAKLRRSFNDVRSEIEREIGYDEIKREIHNQAVLDDLKPGYWGYWAVVREGIYFVGKPADSPHDVVQFYDLRTGHTSAIAPIRNQVMLRDSAFAVSPDGKKILFTQIDHRGSDIMLADNFPSSW